jgi:hypothetical protein
MNWQKLEGALIRAFWTFVFPAIGGGVAYLLEPGVLQSVGVENAVLAYGIGAILYGLKKFLWPDTRI